MKVADQSRSTAKFLDFLEKFQPSPPSRRPKYARLDWRDLRKQLRNIYNFRSEDLHQGRPFPQQMCKPNSVSRAGIASEIVTTLNGQPQISLQTFEYVVRGALHNWCRSTSGGSTVER